jgi:hypothetical protein
VEEELDIGRKVKFLHVVNVTKTIIVYRKCHRYMEEHLRTADHQVSAI